MIPSHGYAAFGPSTPLVPFKFERRAVGPTDVHIEIQYCGVCHSDIHQARNDWGGSQYPVVPGHEIVGRVVKVGRDVKKFKEGDTAAVGCLVDSCGECDNCKEDLEQYCPNKTLTYNSPDKHTGGVTYGGYSSAIVVDEAFALRVPKGLNLAGAAPLLCAGITTYSPLRHWKVGKGQKVGIVGLGGLGHMGVKLANAMGAHVVLFTTSPGKVKDGLALGAHEVVISKNENEMKKHAGSFNFILNTVSAAIDVNAYLELLRRDGTVCQVGAPPEALPVRLFPLIFSRGSLAGSLIGGIRETQEMLDFCGEHNITSEIELIKMDQINEAFERVLKSDVKYHFVIEM